MLFNTQYLSLIFCISTLSSALPLEGTSYSHAIAPRAKPYSIVNVDGGSTSAPPAATTIVEEKTKTEIVEVTAVEPAATSIITTIITQSAPAPAPAPAPTSVSSNTTTSVALASVSTSESTSQPTPSSSETSKPSVVTVIVTAPAGPTEYYDDGQWHTSYIVKTLEAVAAATPSPSVSSLPLTTLNASSI